MGLEILTLGSSKTYTRDSLIGLGALKGAPCTIKSQSETDDAYIVTFEWTGTSGTKKTSQLTIKKPKDGKSAYESAVENGFTGTEQDWISKTFIDNIVTADSDHAVSSKAVKAYVDASVKTEIKTEVSEQIKAEIGDIVQATIEEKMDENMATASNNDIDSLFA